MNKLILCLCLVLAFAVPASADTLFTISGAASDDTSDIVVAGQANEYAVIYNFSFTGGAATDDFVLYEGDDTETRFATAEAASATTLAIASCDGIDNSDVVVLADIDGYPIEMVTSSACNDTTDILTVAAIQNSYQKGGKVYEMISAGTVMLNAGTVAAAFKTGYGSPLFAAKKPGKPLGIYATGTTSVFHWVTGGSLRP